MTPSNHETDQSLPTRARGARAELLAEQRLVELGYKIVDRNYFCKLGEIDLIATQGGDLVFVEVRSRHSEDALNPLFTLDQRKIKRVIKAAKFYVMNKDVDSPMRFDVVIVTLGPDPDIEIIQNAFDAP
ncbi:MAG: YraN family protein [Desulfomonilaceae bacterium]